MAFAPPFQRPFSATFDRRAAVAAAAGYVIDYDGSTSYVNAGSGATIDNLLNAAMTVETWVWADTLGGFSQGVVASKGSYQTHWYFGFASGFSFEAKTGDTFAMVSASAALSMGGWYHVAGTYDNAGDKKMRLWIAGDLAATSAAATGTWISDAAQNLHIGKLASAANRYWDGRIGWLRISNNVRYTGAFTPPSRCSAPLSDANTLLLWRLLEGTGNPQDSSGNANHGTLQSASWQACS